MFLSYLLQNPVNSDNHKFTQSNMYQILSQLVRLCRLHIKKHFGVFFSVHSVYNVYIININKQIFSLLYNSIYNNY